MTNSVSFKKVQNKRNDLCSEQLPCLYELAEKVEKFKKQTDFQQTA